MTKRYSLEAQIRSTELEYELHHGGCAPRHPEASKEMSCFCHFYKTCLDRAAQQHPNASKEELKREARTAMAKAYWTCDTGSFMNDKAIQSEIRRWNKVYGYQSAQNCINGGFDPKTGKPVPSQQFSGGKAQEFIRAMDVNLKPSFLVKKPSNLDLDYTIKDQQFTEPTGLYEKIEDFDTRTTYKFEPFTAPRDRASSPGRTLTKNSKQNITQPQNRESTPPQQRFGFSLIR